VSRAPDTTAFHATDTSAVQVGQEHVDALQAEGHDEYYARWALQKCDGDMDRSRAALRAWAQQSAAGASGDASDATTGAAQAAPGDRGACPPPPPPAASGRAVADGQGAAAEQHSEAASAQEGDGSAEGSGGSSDIDHEAEEALLSAATKQQRDPLAAYDVDVSDEAAALAELHAWLASLVDSAAT
jgi:hypothetical protein